jgi:DNA-binding NarL/FixJ family response regulator
MSVQIFLIEPISDSANQIQTQLRAQPLFKVVGHACSLHDLQHFIEQGQCETVDVFLIDVAMPDNQGIQIIRHLHASFTQAKIFAISSLGDRKHMISCLQAGASGFMLKNDLQILGVQAINMLVTYGSYLSTHSVTQIINHLHLPSVAEVAYIEPALPAPPQLQHNPNIGKSDGYFNWSLPIDQVLQAAHMTPKEKQVIHLLQQGFPAKKIAAELKISTFTVNQHLRSIYRKFGVRNRIEAVSAARSQGFV